MIIKQLIECGKCKKKEQLLEFMTHYDDLMQEKQILLCLNCLNEHKPEYTIQCPHCPADICIN